MKRVIVFSFLLLAIMFIYGQFENTIITVSDAMVEEGDTLWIEVSTTEVLDEWDVIAFQFDLAFDESLIQYEGVALGEMPLPANLIANEYEPGILRTAYANYLNISGTGTLVIIEFIAIGEGVTSLDIYDFKYNSTFLLDENQIDGNVTVLVPNPFSDVIVSVDSPVAGLVENFDLAILTSELTTEMGGISFQFELIYDPEMMTFTGNYALGDVPNPGNLIANETGPGVVVVAYANVMPITGVGSLCTLEFEPAGEEGESIVSLDYFRYNSTNLLNLESGTVYFMGGPQEIEVNKDMVPGWNWFSLNVAGEDMTANGVLASIGEDASNIKSQTQSAIYYAGMGWYGSLTSINNLTFYKIEVENSTTLTYTGIPVDLAATTYSLTSGWNWISYAPQQAEDINYALETVVNGSNIKSQTQSAIYYTGMGWYGSLTTLNPLGGYMLQMNAPELLNYPEPPAMSAENLDNNSVETLSQNRQLRDVPAWSVNPAAYEYNGFIWGQVLVDGVSADDVNDLVAVFVGDECRGLAQQSDNSVQNFDPVPFGYIAFMPQVYSNVTAGETLTFKYYDASADMEYDVIGDLAFTADMVVGGGFDPYIFEVSATPPPEPHFETVWAGDPLYPHNISVLTATINGTALEAGDEVAVFDVDGNDDEICVGVTTVAGAAPYVVSASWDSYMTPTIVDGYVIGHPVIYRIWDASAEVELTEIISTPIPTWTGLYVFQGNTQVLLEASGGNLPPVADAGEDQMVIEGDLVQLDGSASYDPDGEESREIPDWSVNPAAYEYNGFIWGQVLVDGVSADDVNDLVAVFVGDECRGLAQQSDNSVQNFDPVPFGYIAFMPQVYSNVTAGETLTFKYYDASADMEYDVIGDLAFTADMVVGGGFAPYIFEVSTVVTSDLDFLWTAPDGVILSDPTAVQPTFTAPDVTETTLYTISLIVSDGEAWSDADEVVITVENGNIAPIADAGEDQMVIEGDLVQLDGTASYDPDAPIESRDVPDWSINPPDFEYSGTIWGVVNVDGTLSVDVNDMIGVFFGEECRGIAQQSDGSVQDYTALPFGHVAFMPMVYSNVTAGETLTFKYYDASADMIYDVEGTVDFVANMTIGNGFDPFIFTVTTIFIPDLDFVWTAPDGIELNDVTSAIPTFTAPEIDEETPYTFSLIVSDGEAWSEADEVVITVQNGNEAPVIELPPNFTFDEDGSLGVDFAAEGYIWDPDLNDLTLTVEGNVNINVEITGGAVIFSASENWYGSEIMTFTVDDNEARLIASDDVEVIVNPVNDPPVFTYAEPEIGFDEDEDIMVDFSSYISDVDEDELVMYLDGLDDITGDIEGFVITFSAAANWNGTDAIIIGVSDQQGREVAEVNVDIVVLPVNDAPVIDLPEMQEIDEDGSLVLDITPFVSDIDGDVLEISDLSVYDNGEWELAYYGLIAYITPAADYYVTCDVEITITDNAGRETASDMFQLVVNPVNDAPYLIMELPDLEFDEDFEETWLDLSEYFGDVDEDVLTYTADYNAAEIMISFTDNQMYLYSVENWSGTATVTVTASDNVGRDIIADTFEILVNAVNDEPYLIMELVDLEYYEDFEETSFDLNEYFADDDNVLTFSAEYNAEEIMVTIADNMMYLGSVENWYGLAEVTITASDNMDRAIITDTFEVLVISVNDAPYLYNMIDDMEMEEDFESETLILSDYFTDPDGDLNNYWAVWEEGTVNIEIIEVELSITSVLDWNGQIDVTVYVEDNMGDQADFTFQITVLPVNDAPEIDLPEMLSFAEDGMLEEDFSVYIEDVEEDALLLTFDGNENVIVEITDLMVTFSAIENWNGSEEINFAVYDLPEGRLMAEDMVIVEVTSVNDDPIAMPGGPYGAEADAEGFAAIMLDGSGSYDIDGEIVSWVWNWEGGSGEGETFAAIFAIGETPVELTVTDNEGGIGTETTIVNVTELGNTPPIAEPDMYSVFEDEVLMDNVLANDQDPDQYPEPLTAELVADVSNGVLELLGDGSFTYTPAANWNGEDMFSYRAYDGMAYSSETEVAITVMPVNDAPEMVMQPEDINLAEDFEPYEFSLVGYFNDIDNEVLDYVVNNNVEEIAIADMGDGVYEITPIANWNGESYVGVTVTDGEYDVESSFVVYVEAVNDPPYVYNEIPDMELDEDFESVVLTLSDYFMDVDNDILGYWLEYDLEAVVIEIANDELTLSSIMDWNGELDITVIAYDEWYPQEDVFHLVVNPVNDAPTIDLPEMLSFDEDGMLEADFMDYIGDIDGDVLALTVEGGTEVAASIEGYIVTFTASENWFGEEVLTFTIDDAMGRLTASDDVIISVGSVNDNPVAMPGGPYNGQANTEGYAEIELDGSGSYDIDGEIMSWEWSWEGGYGTGETLLAEFPAGETIVTLTVMDNEQGVDEETTTVNVSEYVNIPPIAEPDMFTLDEDTYEFTGNVLVNDYDPDEYPEPYLTMEVVTSPSHGLMGWDEYGSFLYWSLEPDFNGEDMFTYRAYDGAAYSQVVEVTFTIMPVNDPPEMVMQPEDINLAEDFEPYEFSLVGYFNDVDNDVLEYAVDYNIEEIEIADLGNGVFEITPIADWNGESLVGVIVTDGEYEVESSFMVYVEAVNDAPELVMQPDDIYLAEDFEPYEFSLAGYFSDIDNEVLEYAVDFNAEEIEIADLGNGIFEITSLENWNGESYVGVTVTDGEYEVMSNFMVYVSSVNDEPVAEANGPYYEQADEEGNAEITLDGSGSYDIDGEIAAWDWSWEGGSVSGEMPMAVFATGVFEVMLTVTDNEGGIGTDIATVTVSGYENMVPVAEADSFEGEEDTSISGNVLYNDVDPDEYPEAMTADLITDVSWGVLALSANGDFVYMPNENWNGDDSFEYRAFDGIDYSEPVMVALTVIPVNDMPYQTGDLVDIYLLEDFEPYQLDLTGYFGDVEEDELIYEYTFTPEEIVLVFDQSAMIEIQSVENWNGESWVGVAVSDGEYTIDTSFTVYVESINDEPVAEANGPYYSQADEEGNAEVMLDGSGSYDIDGEIVAWDWSWEGGSVSGEMPMAVFATGVFEVMLTVTDDEGGFGTDLATVTVSGYENMAPVAEADSFEGEEDTSISGNVLYNDIDPDEYPEAMTADLITDVSWGALALSANGDFTYMPNENWNGDDSFEYRAFDGIDYSEPVMVALTVISVNDIPYQTGDLVDIYLMEDFEPYQLDLTGYFGDVEEDELIYEYTFTPEEIVIVFDQSAMIEIQSVENWNGESWVGVAVSDGEYTIDTSFMVYVESVNDDPVIELPDSFTMDEAVPFEVDFAEFTSDFDEDVLELTVSGNEYINVLIEGLNVTFDSPSWYGEELLTFTINDNMGRAIDTDDVLLIVRPALFEAEITVGSATVLEDELFTISVSTTELYDYWNVISFEFDINYDAESYEYVGYEAGNVPNPNAMLLVNNSAPGVLAVAYADAIVMSGIGDLVIFEFMAVNAGLSEINAVDFHYNSTEIFNVIQGMVEVIDVNHPPVADAGMDQSPYELEPVMLDGTASYDPDGQDLDYEWIVPDGIELDDPMSATPGFIAPEVIADEEFVFTLNVSDGEYTDSDEVIITVLNINHPPVADAGEDQIVEEGNFVQLDGSGSFDPDGIVFRDVPDWMINPPDYEYSGFIWGMLMLNDVPGDDVNDMIGVFVGDECRGIAQQSDNSVQDYTEPFGHIAFMPQVFSNVTSGETLTFKLYDASAGMIYDIDETLDFVADMTVGDGNDPFIFTVNEEQPTGLEYSWIVPAGIFLENADGPNPTFIAPAVNEDTDFVITLEVSDGEYTDTDEVMITVMDAEIPEIIAEITVTSGVAEPGESVNIDVLTTYIDPLWSVFSYEFWLEYNDAELSLDGWSLDGTIVNPDGELEVIFERGVVNIKFVSQVSSGGREYIPIEGAGSLINLEFTSLTGGQSPLEVYDFTFNSVEVGVINQGVINNNGPTVLIPIPLQTVFEDFGSFTLDLDGYFIDLDEGDELTYINIESGDGIEWGLLDNVLTINSVDNFNGTIPMSVTAWDGYTDSLTVTSEFDIVVTPVNDVPVIDLPEMYSFAEDGELIVDFAPFISDVDGDGLTLSVTGNENITAVITGTMVTFGALENYFGNETLTFAVDDGVDRVTATDDILIEVTSVNDLPVADAGVPINAMAGPEGIALITLNGSGSYDVDGEIIEHYWSWDGGEAYGENPQIELALGNYTISLLVTDNEGGTDSDNVQASVAPYSGTTPIAYPDNYEVDEDMVLIVSAAEGILANDIDDGYPEPLTALMIEEPTVGTLIYNSDDWDGSFEYSAPANWYGIVSFSYVAFDGGIFSDPTEVTIIVNSVNDLPVADAGGPYEAVAEVNGEAIVTLSGSGTDVDGEIVLYEWYYNDEMIGSGSVIDYGFGVGDHEVTLIVTDDEGGTGEDIATVIVSEYINIIPVAVDDYYSVYEDDVLVVDAGAGVLINDYDPDEYPEILTCVLVEQRDFNLMEDGSFEYTPAPDFNGSVNFEYYVTDGEAVSNLATIYIDVMPVNDPPVIELPEEFTFLEDESLELDFSEYISDIDSEFLTLSVSGNIMVLVAIEEYMVTISAESDWYGNETLSFTISDNEARLFDSDDVIINVTAVNDAPVINEYLPVETDITIYDDAIIDFYVDAVDIDSDLEYSWTFNGEFMPIMGNIFTPEFTEEGDYVIVVEITDGEYPVMITWSVHYLLAPDWVVVTYDNFTNAHGYVTVDGLSADIGDMIGAFVDGECRGMGTVNGSSRVNFQIYGDIVEVVNFKFWDLETDSIYDLEYFTQTYPGGNIGSVPNPLPLAVTTGEGPGWVPVIYTNSTIVYALVTIEGVDAEEGDIVAAFVGDECRAVTQVQLLTREAIASLVVQGEIVETVHFRIWDSSEDIIYNVATTIQSNPGGVVGYPPDEILLDGSNLSDVTQTLDLNGGWNLVSLYVRPVDMSVETIFAPIMENLMKVKDIYSSYDPSLPSVYNTLQELEDGSGYYVKVSAVSVLDVTGSILDPTQTQIDLSAGWNLAAYVNQTAMDVETAFAGLINAGTLLKVKDIFSSYDPSLPSAYNTLVNMEPGKGYYVRVSSDTTFYYPMATRNNHSQSDELSESIWSPVIYTNSMIVYVQVDLTGSEGMILGSFAGDECRGVSRIREYNGANISSLVVNSEQPEEIGFRIFDPSSREVYECNEVIISNPGEDYNGMPTLTVNNGDDVVTVSGLTSIYPNPFNPETSISFYLETDQFVSVKVYNVRGQLVKTIINTDMTAGEHILTWNGSNDHAAGCTSGVYFVRFIADGVQEIQKVILMK